MDPVVSLYGRVFTMMQIPCWLQYLRREGGLLALEKSSEF